MYFIAYVPFYDRNIYSFAFARDKELLLLILNSDIHIFSEAFLFI